MNALKDLDLASGILSAASAAVVAVLALAMRSIVTGRLVPAATIDRLTQQWESRLQESRDRELLWQEAYRKASEEAGQLRQQLERLLEYAETSDTVLRSLQQKGAL